MGCITSLQRTNDAGDRARPTDILHLPCPSQIPCSVDYRLCFKPSSVGPSFKFNWNLTGVTKWCFFSLQHFRQCWQNEVSDLKRATIKDYWSALVFARQRSYENIWKHQFWQLNCTNPISEGVCNRQVSAEHTASGHGMPAAPNRRRFLISWLTQGQNMPEVSGKTRHDPCKPSAGESAFH